ncbi:hypothetical protein HYR99_24005 [Candidatus Poribacteria bacterium]|nr:hypothetical protein [Candidatus Poribacteria bacterium]
MYKRILILITLVWAQGALGWLPSVVVQTLSAGVGELLRHRIEAAGSPPKIMVGEESIYDLMALSLFYERRTYQPAWSNDDGPLPQADSLIKTIREANLEGLRPADYHLAKIEATLKGIRQDQEPKPLTPNRLADLDLLLTDAFLTYGSHLLAGRVNPATVDAEWLAERREADLAQVLQTAIVANQIEEALKGLRPPYPGYPRLQEALSHYRDLAAKGGWQQVRDGPKLQMGDCDERVPALWTQL